MVAFRFINKIYQACFEHGINAHIGFIDMDSKFTVICRNRVSKGDILFVLTPGDSTLTVKLDKLSRYLY